MIASDRKAWFCPVSFALADLSKGGGEHEDHKDRDQAGGDEKGKGTS